MASNKQGGKKLTHEDILRYLDQAQNGIDRYLQKNKDTIREEIFKSATVNVPANLKKWLLNDRIDRLSPTTKQGIVNAIQDERWENIIDAFLDEIAFGTGGIRGLAAYASVEDESELEMLYHQGIQAPILKGPNTINDLVLMKKSAGVAKYAKENGLEKVVIGYDSRIQGDKFAELIARIFIANKITVYLFDAPCPYPELTFAIPHIGADFGILISASHNDRRYNGYKLSARSGAQFEKAERDKIYYEYITKVEFEDIVIEEEMPPDSPYLIFLGGNKPLADREYYGRGNSLVDIHAAHQKHIEAFILDQALIEKWAPNVFLGFSAYHGAGRVAVPKLLHQFNFSQLKIISSLNKLDGRFPCFSLEQQPDPGDNIAAEVAVNEFKDEYKNEEFKKIDLLIGTDPDADRAGFIVKVPEKQIDCYKQINKKPPHLIKALSEKISNYKDRDDFSWHLLDADNAWTLLLWYRLMKERDMNNGEIPDRKKKYMALSHTTSDSMVGLFNKYGLGVVKTWVGFGYLANATNMVWQGEMLEKTLKTWHERKSVIGTGDPNKDRDKKIFPGQSHPVLFDAVNMDNGYRSYNFATLEQSNGFSILGPKPKKGEIWGKGGHVRDKDGTFAAMLISEVQAYAKSKGMSLIELLDEHIYLDPEIGLFVNYYEPEPYWGQFEGPTGMSRKLKILWQVEELRQQAESGALQFAGLPVKSVNAYRTGKYDALHRWKLYEDLPYFNGFADEGIRFFFDNEKLNHLTVRPSGTSQCIRFHVQLRGNGVNSGNLCKKKKENKLLAERIVDDIRKKVGC